VRREGRGDTKTYFKIEGKTGKGTDIVISDVSAGDKVQKRKSQKVKSSMTKNLLKVLSPTIQT
jgi:hypothetical protein